MKTFSQSNRFKLYQIAGKSISHSAICPDDFGSAATESAPSIIDLITERVQPKTLDQYWAEHYEPSEASKITNNTGCNKGVDGQTFKKTC